MAGGIAAFAGLAAGGFCAWFIFFRMSLENTLQKVWPWIGVQATVMLAFGVLIGAPTLIAALGTYGLLTRWLSGSAVADGETHCRRCNHILRGLSEPRCPECGLATGAEGGLPIAHRWPGFWTPILWRCTAGSGTQATGQPRRAVREAGQRPSGREQGTGDRGQAETTRQDRIGWVRRTQGDGTADKVMTAGAGGWGGWPE
jgi:hypothetical protein